MTFAQVFDIGAAFALAFFVVRGGMRGLTGEIVSLLGLCVSVLCGWKFARPLSEIAQDYFPTWNPTVTDLACAVIIFMAVSLAFAVVCKIVKAVIKAARLSFLDHALGAVAGGARAFLIVLCVYGVVSVFPVIPGEWMRDSIAMNGAEAVWPPVYKFMTDRGWIAADRLTTGRTGLLPEYFNPSSNASPTSAADI